MGISRVLDFNGKKGPMIWSVGSKRVLAADSGGTSTDGSHCLQSPIHRSTAFSVARGLGCGRPQRFRENVQVYLHHR